MAAQEDARAAAARVVVASVARSTALQPTTTAYNSGPKRARHAATAYSYSLQPTAGWSQLQPKGRCPAAYNYRSTAVVAKTICSIHTFRPYRKGSPYSYNPTQVWL